MADLLMTQVPAEHARYRLCSLTYPIILPMAMLQYQAMPLIDNVMDAGYAQYSVCTVLPCSCAAVLMVSLPLGDRYVLAPLCDMTHTPLMMTDL